MKNIISITFKLLVKRKGFIASITILPLILFLLMSLIQRPAFNCCNKQD